ncbi:MAG: H-NS histone family protein [Pseudomonadota bacterium]
MAIDLSKMSEKELVKLRGEVEKALSGMEKRKRDEARKAVEAAAKKHGFSLNDLIGVGKAGKKPAARAKYRNPADASQTWSGRGRQPVWFKEAIAKGTDPSKLEL